MKLIVESTKLSDYLKEVPPVIQFNSPLVQKKIAEINSLSGSDKERAKIAFELARDGISHSFDTKYQPVTISAEEALEQKEGICFAKSHVLATLLRGMGIPAGFCYQRVLRKGTVESGYALHGLNAVYFPDTGWFRVDPLGNKEGINSQFNMEEEQLAYPIRPELGEVDYPNVYAEPLLAVIRAMQDSKSCEELFYKRPEAI